MTDLDVMLAEHDASERIAFCMESGLGFGHSSVAAALARVEIARANNTMSTVTRNTIDYLRRGGADAYDIGLVADQLEAILVAWQALDLAAQEFDSRPYGPLTLALKKAIESR